jgi:hypothetical protein
MAEEGSTHRRRAVMRPRAAAPGPRFDSGPIPYNYDFDPGLLHLAVPRFAGTARASADDAHHPGLNDPRFGITYSTGSESLEYPPLEALAQWTEPTDSSSSQFTGTTTPSEPPSSLGHFDVEPSVGIEGATRTPYTALHPTTGVGRLGHPDFSDYQHRDVKFPMQAAPITPAPDAAPASKPCRRRGTKRSRKFVL